MSILRWSLTWFPPEPFLGLEMTTFLLCPYMVSFWSIHPCVSMPTFLLPIGTEIWISMWAALMFPAAIVSDRRTLSFSRPHLLTSAYSQGGDKGSRSS